MRGRQGDLPDRRRQTTANRRTLLTVSSDVTSNFRENGAAWVT